MLGKGYSIKPKPEPTTTKAKSLDNQLGPVMEDKVNAELLNSKESNNHSFLVAGMAHLNQSKWNHAGTMGKVSRKTQEVISWKNLLIIPKIIRS
jgi:hypothetical protein